jgi:hypothetical protein
MSFPFTRGAARTLALQKWGSGPSFGFGQYGSLEFYPVAPSYLQKHVGPSTVPERIESYATLGKNPQGLYGVEVNKACILWWTPSARAFTGFTPDGQAVSMPARATQGAITYGKFEPVQGDIVGFTMKGTPAIATAERLVFTLKHPDFTDLELTGRRFYNADGEELRDVVVRRAYDVHPLRFRDPSTGAIRDAYTSAVDGRWLVASSVDPGKDGREDPTMWLANAFAEIPAPVLEENDDGDFVQRGDVVYPDGQVATVI